MNRHVRLIGLVIVSTALPLLVLRGDQAAARVSPGHYQDFGDAGGFMNILPPGQDGVLNGPEALAAQAGDYPPHVLDQLDMYGDLVYNTPGLAEDRLPEFFKDASFGVPQDDIERVYSPGGRTDVVVVRDKSFGVPHIFGDTRYGTMFAQGYTGAEDRLFLMDVLRHVGRARLSEFLGASPANQDMDRKQLAIAPYKEEDLTAQIDAGRAAGPEGEAIFQDVLAYGDGVNAYIQEAQTDPTKLPAEYPALQQLPSPWKPEDAVAIASLVGGVFGKGGGGELINHCGLKKMATALGDADQARSVFDDLHFANDIEAPTSSRHPAPYMTDLGPVDPAAHPDIDCGKDSLKAIDPDGPPLQQLLDAIAGGPLSSLGFPGAMSNALLVSGEHTVSGRPIAIFGPQTGYFIPQLLVEKDVHGPGIDARGVAFAGTDLYVQLGRGRDYAWSATSAGADNVDQFVLRLCEPEGGTPDTDSMGYEHDGVCKPIERFQHTQVAKPSGGGTPEEPDIVLSWRVERTDDYGPLVARGRLEDGTPIAIASLRSTYRSELGSAPAFFQINDPDFMAGGFSAFREAMGRVQYTFNWFYVDDTDIGYQHSCKCPQRAQGVDPYLPVWGTGQWDWQGFISLSAQPFDLNPEEGWLISWNNKQAPGFTASDSNFSFGPTYRSQLLQTRIEAAIAAGKLDRADVVDVMADAGTADLRGQELLPLLLKVLGPTAPADVDPRSQEMRDRLGAWAPTGAHRRDRDHDGQYDDPQAPAIMDAWWPRLAHAMFDAHSANAIGNLKLELEDGNRTAHLGSAFQGAFYSQVNKDVRQVLGRPVQDAWSRTYCGGGDLGECRDVLWRSLAQAAADLEEEFDSPTVGDWKRQLADEDIRHSPVGVTPAPAIHWINRPTFQQLVQIGRPTHPTASFGAGSLDATGGGKIGFVFKVEGRLGGGGSGRFRLHDHSGGHRIDVQEITAARLLTPGETCAGIVAGPADTFEFSGQGSFDDAPGHTVHVCARDGGDPGAGADRLHVDCTCGYSTASASAETLSSGNLKVRVVTPAETGGNGAPSVVALEPALGATALPGEAVTFTTAVYDERGDPLSGVVVTLIGVTASGNTTSLTSVSDSFGQISFVLLTPEAQVAEWTAMAGGIVSNPVLMAFGLEH
ncbi:MAG: penicillin acylase family protein [Chloroflexi bacterium]|nr:penicillin acylase family protein [Chloroflexota bacterium]